jgi:hypothetical protein
MKKIALALLTAALLLAGGCSAFDDWFGSLAEQDAVIAHGTTAGNILNYGFAVQYGDELLMYYIGDTAYAKGSLVRSNPDTGESSLVLDQAGLYMNVNGDTLYYCMEDGVYTTLVDTPDPRRIIEGAATLLQICGERLYYIADGGIECATLDGTPAADFSRIESAGCLNVYADALYYTDTQTGYIQKADLDGSGIETVYGQSVEMFCITDDVIYFIDSADGFIRRMALADVSAVEPVVEYPCSGFNVNRSGIYYTRDVDGKSLCCNAGTDGYQEKVLSDFGESAWHIACLWNRAAIVAQVEGLPVES